MFRHTRFISPQDDRPLDIVQFSIVIDRDMIEIANKKKSIKTVHPTVNHLTMTTIPPPEPPHIKEHLYGHRVECSVFDIVQSLVS